MKRPNILFIIADQLHGFEERVTTDISPSALDWPADWERRIELNALSKMSMHGAVESGLCMRSLQIDYDDVAHEAAQWLYGLSVGSPCRG